MKRFPPTRCRCSAVASTSTSSIAFTSFRVFAIVRGYSTSDPAAAFGSKSGELPTIVVVTSLEPVRKKHAFLRTAARELSLRNLDPQPQRIEDHAFNDYDAAMSRATFDLVEWLETGLRHVSAAGIVLGFEAVPRKDLPAGVERHA